jgi:hypothetical protein
MVSVPCVGGDEEEARAGICRDAFAEDEGIFVVRGPGDELIRRGVAQSVRAEVGISHRDAGRWRQPDSDGVRTGTEGRGPGEDAIVEIKQPPDVVEHQSGELRARRLRESLLVSAVRLPRSRAAYPTQAKKRLEWGTQRLLLVQGVGVVTTSKLLRTGNKRSVPHSSRFLA